MKTAPIPENEGVRQSAVEGLQILDTPREPRFDAITDAATQVFNVPISTLTIVDKDREWFKSCQGLPDTEGARAISFCGHALLEPKSLIILDATQDVRFSDNPMVTGKPYIRFYAGIPLFSANGERVGVLCLKDTKRHAAFSADDEAALQCLAHWAEQELNHRSIMTDLRKCDDRSTEDLGAIVNAYSKKVEEVRALMTGSNNTVHDADAEEREAQLKYLEKVARDIKAEITLKC